MVELKTEAEIEAIAAAGAVVAEALHAVVEHAAPGQPTGQRVGICYNSLRSSPAQVQAEAQRECAPDTAAQPVDSDWYMQYCPLLLPDRATFVCVAKK